MTYISWSSDFCLISWRLFDVWTSLFGIVNQYDPMFHLKINVSQCDLYFMVQWFLPYISKTSWWMSVIFLDNETMWHKLWPQKTNILMWDCESVWPDSWPKNKCRSLCHCRTRWHIFHGPVILCYILKTIWCMNIILGDYGSVWPDVLPQNKCMSLWPMFHGPLILPYISKTSWWMSVIFLDNETVWQTLTSK